jgi:Chlorophyll A-B binding protein
MMMMIPSRSRSLVAATACLPLLLHSGFVDGFLSAPPSRRCSIPLSLSNARAELERVAEAANPRIGYFDPLKLADADFWGMGNDATIGWLRHSEIKHGRIAQAAFVGYVVQSSIRFPWPLTLDGTAHPSTDLGPEMQWDALPREGKLQILALIGFLEVWDELGGGAALPHYTKGRKPGQYPPFAMFREKIHPVLDLYDPFGVSGSKLSETQKERGLIVELNNGRLAMIGIFGFLCANKISGSVPLLDALGAVKPYDGEPMAPFMGQLGYFGL